jgi:methanethiol S-methyltransferase
MMAKRLAIVLYGLVSYLIFLGWFLYAIGFFGNLWVPKSIDVGAAGSGSNALFVDVALLALFGVQHSVMARPAFKARWTRLVPAAIERSTFVLFASLIFLLVFWQWQPLPAMVWQVEAEPARTAVLAVFWLGWGVVLLSTFLINHFHLFGLQQVYAELRSRPLPPAKFVVPILYRFIRHPIMLGFLLAFWATPDMTVGHLLFAVVTTGYVLIGISFEERDLRKAHGAAYDDYRERVPMLVPFLGKGEGVTRPPDLLEDVTHTSTEA